MKYVSWLSKPKLGKRQLGGGLDHGDLLPPTYLRNSRNHSIPPVVGPDLGWAVL